MVRIHVFGDPTTQEAEGKATQVMISVAEKLCAGDTNSPYDIRNAILADMGLEIPMSKNANEVQASIVDSSEATDQQMCTCGLTQLQS